MLPEILALSPMPPLLAAVMIGCGMLAGVVKGEASERFTSRLGFWSVSLSLLLIIIATIFRFNSEDPLADRIVLGTWIKSGSYHIDLAFIIDGLSLAFAGLTALFAALVMRFSINYIHREGGFHRFFLVLCLFSAAMLVLATAGNAALCFVGWELAGVCSFLLIAYQFDRSTAALNATRALITNRIGDAGFILGIVFSFLWVGDLSWSSITGLDSHLEEWQAGVLACCFLMAAIAKSALVPLAPWLARAMEGPTPSSAIFYGVVMVHAGVYLVLRLQGLFEQAPFVMGLMAVIGLLTAFYGYFCGLVQSDVKSSLIFSTTGQLGLMFLAAGLGFWRLALFHLCAHALFRGYQFLASPSLMHGVIGISQRPATPWLGKHRLLYLAALQRLWLENIGDQLVVKPVQQLGADLNAFDHQVIDPVFGLPAPMANLSIQSTVGFKGGEGSGIVDPEVLRVSGLFGLLMRTSANASYWFEEKLVLQGLGPNMLLWGRRLGTRLNEFERMLNQPRYLIVFILATLLAVF